MTPMRRICSTLTRRLRGANQPTVWALAAVCLMATTSALRAQISDPVHFTTQQRRSSQDVLEVLFTAKIAPGWHVYGTDIDAGGPTRATLTLEHTEGLTPLGPLETRGEVHSGVDDIFGVKVSYMEGTATFAQRFTLTGGQYSVEGYLTYGACDDQNCLPPTDVSFSFSGEGPATPTSSQATKPQASPQESTPPAATAAIATPTDSLMGDSSQAATPPTAGSETSPWWQPVREELQALGDPATGTPPTSRGLLTVFLLGLLGGLAALLTPCVWPIIPMTVSFFLKRNQSNHRKAIREALTYGLSIVIIYVALGLLVTILFGASALNSLSTNAVFNIFFFLLLVIFGLSFLGGFDIRLPSAWGNAVNSRATKTTGVLSIFLMAATLALVSFSCTGPIIGFLLVEVTTSGGITAPALGMLGFAIALALPFTLFAIAPGWLRKAPKSGNWMNCIKVSLGFVELAFSLKFLSVADLAYGWHLLDREVFLSLWIVLFALWGCYLLGWIRFPHDEEEYDEQGEPLLHHRTSVLRFLLGVVVLSFALYMIPGLWGAPCKAISAFAPPLSTQDWVMSPSTSGLTPGQEPAGEGEAAVSFHDYDEGMAYAARVGKPVLLDFTGYGCVNCRKMEAAVWSDPAVSRLISSRYVLISLYVDDKTPLPHRLTVSEQGKPRTLRTVGDRWSYLQRIKFGANAQPFYVLVDNEGLPLAPSRSYDEDVPAYVAWLNQGLARYQR